MEINTEVQTAAILRGGEITYYDAAGRAARQWDSWKHDRCVTNSSSERDRFICRDSCE